MNDYTPEEIKAAISVVREGDFGVIKKILEFQKFLNQKEDDVQAMSEKLDSVVKSLNLNKVEEAMNEIRSELDAMERNIEYTLTAEDKADIASLIEVPVMEKVVEQVRTEVIREQPLVTEITKEVAVMDKEMFKAELSKQGSLIRDALELLKNDARLDISAIRGLDASHGKLSEDIINRAIGIVDQRTSFLINKVSNLSDRVNNATGGGHTIQDEGTPLTQRTNLNFKGAGVVATDDPANNATIITISTSAGAGYQQPSSGVIDGSNATYVWATAPNAIVVDGGRSIQKTSSDGTVNWTGTTTTVLAIAPTFDVFGIA